MKVFKLLLLIVSLCLSSCSGGDDREKDEIDVDNMVLNGEEESEWVAGAENSSQDMSPLPQERIISETLDAPVKQDPTDACR